jgi:hypothetical protein
MSSSNAEFALCPSVTRSTATRQAGDSASLIEIEQPAGVSGGLRVRADEQAGEMRFARAVGLPDAGV